MKNDFPEIDPSQLKPFIDEDGRYVVPYFAKDGDSISDGQMLDPKQFMKNTHQMSDKELNAVIYNQAKFNVEHGIVEPWPEDDYGTVIWFQRSFISPEMREVFPAIVKEYLANEPLIGTEFAEIPYQLITEVTWDDALNFRVLAMMVMAARKGSVYSRNFLISLYKVYYRREYNRVKRLRTLTYLDVLEMHDEYCKQQGYVSGHTTDGKTFHDATIERRKHEPGWMHVADMSRIDPNPGKKKTESDTTERINDAIRNIRDISSAPDEPPMQPTASRLFIMCEMLRIPIDPTCNEQANVMNLMTKHSMNLQYLDGDEHRRLVSELTERFREHLNAYRPETADPYIYQSNRDYASLEAAEMIMNSAFLEHNRNYRVPYDSKKFDLQELIAKVIMVLEGHLQNLQFDYNNIQMLAMVRYLSECVCELLEARDREIDDILHFSRRRHEGEQEITETNERGERFIKSVEGLRKEKTVEPVVEQIVSDWAEVEQLKTLLDEREEALVEAEQKVIRQRALYEKEREAANRLRKENENAADEHAELIALREYVYSLRDEADIELDEKKKEDMIAVLQDKKVAVIGGQERWAKRMRRYFPKWKFISVDDDSIGGFSALEGADYIYMYTSALQHKQYYRAMNLIRKTGKMLFYLGSTNFEENLSRFHRDLYEGLKGL